MRFFKWGVELFSGFKIGGHSMWLSRLFKLGKVTIYINPIHRYETQLMYKGGQNYFIHIGRLTFHWIGPSFYSPPDQSLFLIYPPWDVQQVNRLYKSQSNLEENSYHFTCGTCFKRLIPEKNGWICPDSCDPPREQYAYKGMISEKTATNIFFPFEFFLKMHEHDSIFYIFGKIWEDIIFRVELFLADNFPDMLEYLRRQRDLFWIRFYGFDPIGVTYFMHDEPSFLFRTEDECNEAFHKLEHEERKVFGYWVVPGEAKGEFNDMYPEEDFNESVYYFYENLNL